MYSKGCWGFRASNFIWLSRVSRPLLYSYIIPTLITQCPLQSSSITSSNYHQQPSQNYHQYYPPTINNIVLQPSSILSSNQHQYCSPTSIIIVLQPPSLLSSNQHQYCPPNSINIVLQPSSILSSNHHQNCPPTTFYFCRSRLIPSLPSDVYLRI